MPRRLLRRRWNVLGGEEEKLQGSSSNGGLAQSGVCSSHDATQGSKRRVVVQQLPRIYRRKAPPQIVAYPGMSA